MFSIVGSGFASFDLIFFRLSLFRIMMLIITGVALYTLIKKREKIDLTFKYNQFSIQFLILWLIYAIITVFWVQDITSWMRAVFFISIGVLSVFLMRRYFNDVKSTILAFYSFIPMIIFHVAVGYYEVITRIKFTSLISTRVLLSTPQPFSTFVNTNDYALFLVFAFFLMYFCLKESKMIAIKSTIVLFMTSIIVLIVLSGSRASLLGIILGSGVIVALEHKIKQVIVSLSIASLLLLLVYFIYPNIAQIGLDYITSFLNFDFTRSTGSEVVRLNLIKNGLHFLVRTFGFGTGAGNIEFWMENVAILNVLQVYNIHNWWMEILVSYGVLIFILYIIFYFNIIRVLFVNLERSSGTSRSISISIIAIMVSYLITSFSSSSNLSSEWLWMFWGVVVTYQGLVATEKEVIDNK